MQMEMRKKVLFNDALALWHMKNLEDMAGNNTPLAVNGNVKFGYKLTGDEYEASVGRGGDGYVALFKKEGWLSTKVDNEPKEWLQLNGEEMSLCIRMCMAEGGGIWHSNLFSLVTHENGLVIGYLGIQSGQKIMYREIALTTIEFNQWYDIIILYKNHKLESFFNGEKRCTVQIVEQPKAILSGPSIIGGWKIKDPPLIDFPQGGVNEIFQRLFKGSIDHVMLWNKAISDEDIALLSDKDVIEDCSNDHKWQECLRFYNSFHEASVAKDTQTCEKIGLSIRKFMAQDPTRPVYHLTATLGWLLDPAGAFYHNGKYHVYSYRSIFSCLAFDSLSHYESKDMIHWKDMPVGVWANSDLDIYGIWLANCFIDDHGIPGMIYTSHGTKGKIGVLARSTDDFLSFNEKEPVIADILHHDGHTWKDGDTWFTITTRQHWGRLPGDLGDEILMLTSKDLKNWTNQGVLFSVKKHPDPINDLEKWGFTEFPYLIPFGEKYVFMTGTRPVLYWVGEFDKENYKFLPDHPEGKLLDYLNPFHCFNPSTVDFKGDKGSQRRIIYSMHPCAKGKVKSLPWNGAHLLPRILDLDTENARLTQEPIPEVKALRGQHYHCEDLLVQPDKQDLIEKISGDTLEIIAEFELGDTKCFGLKVRVSDDRSQFVRIYYDVNSDIFGVDGDVLDSAPFRQINSGPAYIECGKFVKIRVFLDKCLLEAFVNGNSCSGIFTTDTKYIGLGLFSEGGGVKVKSLDIWEMKSAW